MIYRLVTGHRRTAANVEREVHVVELDVAATSLATDLVLGVARVGHRRDIQALTRVVARLGDRERLRDIVAARFLLERRNGLRAVTAEDISGVVSGVVLALGTCLVGSGNVILVGTVLVVIALVAIESVQEIIGYAALVAFVGSVAFVVFAVVVVDNFVATVFATVVAEGSAVAVAVVAFVVVDTFVVPVFATVVVEGIAVTGGVALFVLARVCTFVCTLLHRRLHPRRCLGSQPRLRRLHSRRYRRANPGRCRLCHPRWFTNRRLSDSRPERRPAGQVPASPTSLPRGPRKIYYYCSN